MSKLEAFLFQEVDGRKLALLRIALGLLILISTFRAASLNPESLKKVAWIDRTTILAMNFEDPWTHVADGLGRLEAGIGPIELVTIAILASSFTLGYLTRFSQIALLVSLAIIRSKNSLFSYGGDDLLRIFLFCLVWAPLNAAWSVDGIINKRLNHRARIWPLRLIQFQIFFVYIFAGLSKLLGKDWLDGSALFYVLQDSQFNSFDLMKLLSFHWAEQLLKLASQITPFFELSLPLIIGWKKTRILGLLVGGCFHLMIFLFWKTELFGFAMMVGYLTFIPESFFFTPLDSKQNVFLVPCRHSSPCDDGGCRP